MGWRGEDTKPDRMVTVATITMTVMVAMVMALVVKIERGVHILI